jgi:hypothetical protein
MKYFKNYLSALIVFSLIFTSCSKEETSALDDADANFVELTFGAVLNDLANRAANKQSVGELPIPDCATTAPDYARINFSYGGEDYEVVVDILSDSEGYFTDYSEELKIPVNGGSTNVTLTGFLVYDSSDTIIWAAPVGSQFANYVGNVLPQSFNVAAGTKPYIDVDVLCFDRRMVNEYGYVFFDIIPEVIYPLCVFVNYCNEAGRHWVANYSIDLFFGTSVNGIQLYDNEDAAAQATVGMRDNGEYYASPLCLVVPGPPANLADDQPYLYMVIYPNDWEANYGDIDNTPIPVQLSWNDVNALLNNDGTTNEYLHLLIGECEGALSGDGTITPPPCDLTNPNLDCDNDGILNKCDEDNPYWGTFDCDGDGFLNAVDACPNIPGVAGGVGGDGCPAGNGGDLTCQLPDACVLNTGNGALGDLCEVAELKDANTNGFVQITSQTTINLVADSGLMGEEEVWGVVTWTVTGDGDLVVTIDGSADNDFITAYAVEVHPSNSDGSINTTCYEFACANLGSTGTTQDVVLNFDDYDYSTPFYIKVSAVICGVPVPPGG